MNSLITIKVPFLLSLTINTIKAQLSQGMFDLWISRGFTSPLMEAVIGILIL